MAAPAEGQGGTERVELRFPVAERNPSPLAAVVELVVIVALALGLTWLVQQYIVKSYRVPTGSMRPTIDEGDRVLAARFLSWFADPDRGDVIVFHPPGVGDVPQRGARTAGERDVRQARGRTARRDRAGRSTDRCWSAVRRASPAARCASRTRAASRTISVP